MIPSAKIVNLFKAPPANKSKKSSTPALSASTK